MLKVKVCFLFLLIACLSMQLMSCQENPFIQGEIMYENFCATCHMEDGKGLKGLIPPLANSDWLKNNQDILACSIRKGINDPIVVNGKTYELPMAGVTALTEFELANVINYINQAWGNDYGFVQINEVRDQLDACNARD